MSIDSVICGHCGQVISFTTYHACKLCGEPVCEACAPDPYCRRTKEHYPEPPEAPAEAKQKPAD